MSSGRIDEIMTVKEVIELICTEYVNLNMIYIYYKHGESTPHVVMNKGFEIETAVYIECDGGMAFGIFNDQTEYLDCDSKEEWLTKMIPGEIGLEFKYKDGFIFETKHYEEGDQLDQVKIIVINQTSSLMRDLI